MNEVAKAELVDIHEVTRMFGLSIEAIRKYKALGLIEPCQRVGRKDLYNEEEVFGRIELIKSYKQQGKSLREIQNTIMELKEQQYFENRIALHTDVKRILIIEDEDLLVNLLKEQLRTRFCESELRIYDARDGLTGMEIAKRIKPDLIILDLLLPNIEGKRVHQILTRQLSTRESKFLILSGRLIYRPKNAVFIKKPFDMDRLLDTVATLLGMKTG